MGNKAIVERYAAAVEADDFDAQDGLLHDDYVLTFPQSGERFVGRANRRFVYEQYPGREEAGNRPSIGTITGTDDRFVSTPSWPAFSVVHLAGSDDEFTTTGKAIYPDGQEWHWVSLIQMRDGKVWRETAYFALPFEAPDWRASVREVP